MIGWSGFDSRRGLGIFLFDTKSRAALESTQSPIQWVSAVVSLGLKRPGRAADHSPPSSAEVKECVELYLHSPNTSSWRTILPLPYKPYACVTCNIVTIKFNIKWIWLERLFTVEQLKLLFNTMEESFLIGDSHSASQEIPRLFRILKFHYCVYKSRHWSLSRATWIQSAQFYPLIDTHISQATW
jgi:hypothetical protein